MISFKSANDLRKWTESQRKEGKIIGFVPTMGALHPGHISLIQLAQKDCDVTVCSIFVNPTQFNDPADFEKYPVTIERDIHLLLQQQTDALFLPAVAEIYPEGTGSLRHYALGDMDSLLEGKYRPGHFQGVCNVVHRLLDMVQPDHLYLGQKDCQQCMVINRLLQLTGMDNRIQLHIAPTLREPDGLAMSSRNRRLTPEQRALAPLLYQQLSAISRQLHPGDITPLLTTAIQAIEKAGFRPDYFEIADASTLQPVHQWDGRQSLVALVAAFLGDVRLIDNLPLN